MAKGALTAVKVKALLKVPGRHVDGEGLMLVVGKTGRASWLLRVQHQGKRRDIGLGSESRVGLSEARDKAEAARKLLFAGKDPSGHRKPVESLPTFKEAAERVFEEHKAAWKHHKHRDQWIGSLRRYAFDKLGSQSVDRITTPDVLEVLRPIWLDKPETARRVYRRIVTVISAASVIHEFDPPNLSNLVGRKALPKQPPQDRHYAAMPYVDIPTFYGQLATQSETMGRLSLRFVILTAARSGEVRGATWSEIDLDAKLWRVPTERMKAGCEHVVPLSAPAIAILERASILRNHEGADLVFPGNLDRPLSDMTLIKILRDCGLRFTVHGFRSSFKDWSSEETPFPDAVSEAALAHGDPDKVRAAYRRTDFLAKRRQLMDDWAAYATNVSGKRKQATTIDPEAEAMIG